MIIGKSKKAWGDLSRRNKEIVMEYLVYSWEIWINEELYLDVQMKGLDNVTFVETLINTSPYIYTEIGILCPRID